MSPAMEATRFTPDLTGRSTLRDAITAAYRRPEPEAVKELLRDAHLPPADRTKIQALAQRLAQTLRERKAASGRAGLVQGLLQQFSLSSQEGVALMCMAEALLRIPDAATRDALIRDKVSAGNWRAHLGHSPSLFVNAAAWGLLLTGKLVATHSEAGLTASLGRLIGKGGEPLIRKGVDLAMRMMGEQFVAGETIIQALDQARPREAQGFRYSYDMLGEAALTAEDAKRYLASYEQAIHAIGGTANGRGIYEGPGISIKVSALHPRYCRAQLARVMEELYPRLLHLTQLAKRYDIGLNIDAEEADRLELSLDLLERLCHEPSLAGWHGIGFVIQAYQKRCPCVIDYLIDLARRSDHRLMVRLVKGAYWDSEIKRAQVDGLEDYPVYTRKPHTDLSYLACARRLLAAPESVYPQFATHNAQTLAAIVHLAGPHYHAGQYEFQCLHGMGESLYEQVVGREALGQVGRPCRIYAPVGTHDTLLAYLVRRLLENGANTSFVNRIADPDIPLEILVQDPAEIVTHAITRDGALGLPHPAIASPHALYGSTRANARGLDLSNELQLAQLTRTLAASECRPWSAAPMLAKGGLTTPSPQTQPVRNPADPSDVVGQVREAEAKEVRTALEVADRAAPDWAEWAPAQRAAVLQRAADDMEAHLPRLMSLLMREAGKTAANAVAEVREAVDFLRYDAHQVASSFHNATHLPLGPVVCISPWNFPLAIFTGQVAAALAAGNVVLAKPAEQTPLVAAEAVRLLWAAGIPRGALQLLPGRGETVGAQLVADSRVQGVLFTGSTEVARILQRTLANRLGPHGDPVPLIAETGGQNAMIVDSSALAEQVVADVLTSAFDSAGQRCSALRLLCVQEDVADRVFEMLREAMREYCVGDPRQLATDIGPVIDDAARDAIEKHIDRLRSQGRRVHQPGGPAPQSGNFVLPTLIEIEQISELQGEVFGPVLHCLRYVRSDLGHVLEAINATGYGLTMGLHTRIDETIARVEDKAKVGNLYVNRNVVGAVVGVQPFGGEGLSGTGPKAGGPLYLLRLLARRPLRAARAAIMAADAARPTRGAGDIAPPQMTGLLGALHAWAQSEGLNTLAEACALWHPHACSGLSATLAGPTGERNVYRTAPRERILCLAAQAEHLLWHLAAVCAVGSTALWPTEGLALLRRLPPALQARIEWVEDWTHPNTWYDAVLHTGEEASLRAVSAVVASRAGPIISVTRVRPDHIEHLPLERLVLERTLSVNTAAAGGNASLMTMA